MANVALKCSSGGCRPVQRSAVRRNNVATPTSPFIQRAGASNVSSRRVRALHIACAAAEVSSKEAAVIPEEELIELTKKFIAGGFRDIGASVEMLDDDMIFRGPVVGPLTKDVYLQAVTGFNIVDGFPDIDSKSFGFSVDPTDPYRVWFFTQITGTHTQPWKFGGGTFEPTGGKILNGTEANSLIWTPDRKVKYISIGYCADRINSNTPNGTMKIAVAGFLRAAGQGQLWDVITNPVVTGLTNFVNKLQGKPTTRIEYEDLPAWWKELPDSKLRGAEGYHK